MRPKTYLYAFIQSISSAEYYRDVLRAPLWFSVRFFLISLALIGVVETTHFLIKTVPQAEQFMHQVATEVKVTYPKDLIIEWDGNQLSASNPLLQVSYPQAIDPDEYNLPPYLAQFQTSSTTLDDTTLNDAQSLFVISSNTVYMQDSNNAWSDTNLSSILPKDETFVLTTDTIDSSVDSLVEAIYMTREIFIALGAIAMITITILSTIFILIIESLLGFLLVRIYGYQLSIRDVFQLGLHIIVPAHIAHTVALFAFPTLTFPILSVSFWVLFVYIVYTNRAFLSKTYKK